MFLCHSTILEHLTFQNLKFIYIILKKSSFFLLDAINASIAKIKHINSFREQNVESLYNVKAGGMYNRGPKYVWKSGTKTFWSPGRFEVHIAVSIKSMIFWDMIQYYLVGRHHCFRGSFCHHLQVRRARFLWNSGTYLPGCTASHSRKVMVLIECYDLLLTFIWPSSDMFCHFFCVTSGGVRLQELQNPTPQQWMGNESANIFVHHWWPGDCIFHP